MLRASAIVLTFCLVLASWAAAQTPPSSTSDTRSAVELVGCVSEDPGTSGAFTLNESAGGTYRLTGKSVRKYAGQMVRLVGGPQGKKKLSIRGGLWPSPKHEDRPQAAETRRMPSTTRCRSAVFV